jgi:predicted enzyme related to lactoylglutathione lyase
LTIEEILMSQSTTKRLRGFATITLYAEDLAAAQKWYTELLGIAPYFTRPAPDGKPAYVEYRVGDYERELGIINRRFAPPGTPTGPGSSIIYWRVDDVTSTLDKLLSMGAKPHQPRIERRQGFVTASVLDPFSNLLGIMYNPHYVEILSKKG